MSRILLWLYLGRKWVCEKRGHRIEPWGVDSDGPLDATIERCEWCKTVVMVVSLKDPLP